MRVSRRTFALGAVATLASRPLRAAPPGGIPPRPPGLEDEPLELRALRIEQREASPPGDREAPPPGYDVLLALPRDAQSPVPLVILLHGLGETSNPRTGARAWVDLYGLASSVRRLTHGPLVRASARDDWGSALATTNAELAREAYRGLAFACPFVPRMAADKLDAYARWLDSVLVPRVRAEAGARVDASLPRIGGCSYGGWVSLEILLRAPERFGAWAGVQTAIARDSAAGYADRLARVAHGRPLLFETSTGDPFHDANVALAGELIARGIPCDTRVLPGPHDQPWLREAGTPSLLQWLDRASAVG
jgi:pimeloyl-ACP methyl ester carboxylesterase